MSNTLVIRNPHSVIAALQHRPNEVKRVVLPTQIEKSGDEAWKTVWELAKKNRIQITTGTSSEDRRRDKQSEGGRASVAEALIEPREPVSAEELFEGGLERAGGRGIWLALDCLTDPHNVGAIFRTAAFFGIQGILLTQERSAPLTGTVYDIACGGVESVPHTLQINLQRAFEIAKDEGLWILGTSEHAKETYLDIKRDRPWLVVLGNEEKGMRRLTQEACDLLVQIPPIGDVTSLNVSVSSGIFLSRLSSLQGS